MNKYHIIEDHQIAEELAVSLENVRKYMKIISAKPNKHQWIVVCLKNRCIFYNVKFIQEFVEIYNAGFNEKNILNALIKNYPIKSRAEIKAIEETLIEIGKIEKRDPSQIKLLTFDTEFTDK
jgi:hypothetical protein